MVSFEEMVGVVEGWFLRSKATDQQKFIDTPFEKLIRYHDSVGRSIRNEFKLWETHWTPEIKNGADYSPNHPDQISMRVIEEVWTRLRGDINENL